MTSQEEIEKRCESYIHDFCFKNTDYHIDKEKSTEKMHITFDNPQAMLTARLMGVSREDIFAQSDNLLINQKVLVNYENFNFLKFSRYNYKNLFDCAVEIGKGKEPECYFGLCKKVLTNENYFKQNFETSRLNYDGICAFLALAPEKLLLNSKDFVLSEIGRNNNEQIEYAQKNGLSSESIGEIGGKYIELACVAGKMLDMSQQKIDQEKEDNISETAEAYTRCVENFDEMLGVEE